MAEFTNILLISLTISLIVMLFVELIIKRMLKRYKKQKKQTLEAFIDVLERQITLKPNQLITNKDKTKLVMAVGVEHCIIMELTELEKGMQLKTSLAVPFEYKILTKAKGKKEKEAISAFLDKARNEGRDVNKMFAIIINELVEFEKNYTKIDRHAHQFML